MIINILSPLKGRKYTIFDYINQVKRIIKLNPEITFNWIIYDNTQSAEFLRIFRESGLKYRRVIANGYVDGYEYINTCHDLSKQVAKACNSMVREMPVCDYALLIEDDIICQTENPIPAMLKGFELKDIDGEKVEVGAVSAAVFNKRLTERFGVVQSGKYVDGKYVHSSHKKGGYTKVNCTSFGFIMFKYDLIKESPFRHGYKGNISVDYSYGLYLMDKGLSIAYCWDIDIWHYYKSLDGIVGYSFKDSKKITREKEVKTVTLLWAKSGSPEFFTVPVGTVLTKELVESLKKERKICMN